MSVSPSSERMEEVFHGERALADVQQKGRAYAVLPVTGDMESAAGGRGAGALGPVPPSDVVHHLKEGDHHLSSLDMDGDGKINQDELGKYVTQHNQTKQDKSILVKALAGVTILLFLFAGAMAWSTFTIVDSSKDTQSSSSQNALRDRESGFMVATTSPLVYVDITEIALLPAAAINSLKVKKSLL
jgi:hypothetical protein